MPENSVTCLARITGRVQGVGFRAWTKLEADKRHLTGWVRNRRNGSVEALINGPPTHVQSLLNVFLEGLPLAWVEAVTTEPASSPEIAGFYQLATP